MRTRDLILGIDGSHVHSVDDIQQQLADWIAAHTVYVSVLRGRERVGL